MNFRGLCLQNPPKVLNSEFYSSVGEKVVWLHAIIEHVLVFMMTMKEQNFEAFVITVLFSVNHPDSIDFVAGGPVMVLKNGRTTYATQYGLNTKNHGVLH